MDFDLSDDQQMLAKTVADYRKRRSPVERFRKLRDAEGVGWEPEAWREMGELGWLGVAFPEEAGGLGRTFVDLALILEQLGHTLVPEPVLASVVLGGFALALAGDEGQCERFLAPMIEGETSLALAWAEAGGRFDPTVVECEARAGRDGFVLHGHKRFVLNGHAADQLIVTASTSEGLSLFVVDGDAPGLTRTTVGLIDGHRGAHLKLEGVEVGADRRLAAAMLEITREYLGTREQFGVKIGSFQVLQHRTVDMFVELELLRSINMESMARADAHGQGERTARALAVSAAKHQLATGGQFISRQSVQLHGGIGITDEHDIGMFFKRMQALTSICGDDHFHAARYAKLS